MIEIPTKEDIERILYQEIEIHQKVAELGQQISKDYAEKEIHTITILKGADAFANDLVQQIDSNIPLFRDYIDTAVNCRTPNYRIYTRAALTIIFDYLVPHVYGLKQLSG